MLTPSARAAGERRRAPDRVGADERRAVAATRAGERGQLGGTVRRRRSARARRATSASRAWRPATRVEDGLADGAHLRRPAAVGRRCRPRGRGGHVRPLIATTDAAATASSRRGPVVDVDDERPELDRRWSPRRAAPSSVNVSSIDVPVERRSGEVVERPTPRRSRRPRRPAPGRGSPATSAAPGFSWTSTDPTIGVLC